MSRHYVGAGSAFPSIVALIPMGENVDTRALLKQILDMSSDCPVRYSPLGAVFPTVYSHR